MTSELTQTGMISERKLLGLIRELAMDITPVETILTSYQITAKELENYLKHPRIRAMLSDAVQVWNGATNVEERLKLKQLTMVEEVLPELFARLHDPKEPLSGKVELFKALQKGAGVGAVTDQGNAAKISININLGDRREPITLEATPIKEIEA